MLHIIKRNKTSTRTEGTTKKYILNFKYLYQLLIQILFDNFSCIDTNNTTCNTVLYILFLRLYFGWIS